MISTDVSNRRGAVAAGNDPLQLLTTRELMGFLRLSRVGVWRLTTKLGAAFPKAIILGHNQKRWRRHEIDAWLSERPRSAT